MSEAGRYPVARPLRVIALALAVVALAVSARLSLPVPGSPVPMTLQSLAVLCVGILLGPGQGLAALAIYLLVGALGAPVFAGGNAGLETLTGPTGGFLVGFLPGVWLAGAWTRSGRASRLGSAWLGMGIAQAVILACGWTRLAAEIGGMAAWAKGVWPFLPGALIKSLAAAAVARLVSNR
jgi:biotin transport system substrate-specific component